MNKHRMYIVRFVRKDGKPDEEYYYQELADAKEHFRLFEKDDSNLYTSILLTSDCSSKIIDALIFLE